VLLTVSAQCPLLAQQAGRQGDDQLADATATSVPETRTVWDGRGPFRRFLRDERLLWTAPFRRSTYGSPLAQKYGVPFVLISGGLLAMDERLADLQPNSNDQTVWSGRVSQLGASYSLTGFSGVMYLAGKLQGSRRTQEAGLLSLAALAHTHIVVFGLKQATQRERPLTGDQDGSFWEGGNSFPSGHAATSFAVATVFAYEYRDHPAVPITAYALASAISASRLGAQRHWASDIFVGGSLGFLIGRFVYRQHRDRGLSGPGESRRSRWIPAIGLGGGAASLSWRF
jgi:membrane-associated phospholipid phosphatase